MWPQKSDKDRAWGQQLLFQAHHVPFERLERMRFQIDNLADDALTAATERRSTIGNECVVCCNTNELSHDSVAENEPPIEYRFCEKCRATDGVYIPFVDKNNNQFWVDKRLNDYWCSVVTVPDWVDWSSIQRGQEVFFRYSSSAAMGLLYFSLIGGLSAPKILKVLDSTSYMTKHEDQTWLRLNETLQMVIDCLDSPDALKPGHAGWKAVLKVRIPLG